MPASRNSRLPQRFKSRSVLEVLAALALACLVFTVAARWFVSRGYTLYFGDATAHLNIARRIVDSKTPGYEQIGTVWLPLPHIAMIPFVTNDDWWRSGAAGAIPAVIASVMAGVFLFLFTRRLLGAVAGFTALGLFLTNPNLVYLGSIPMTEPFFFACFLGALYFLTVARQSGSLLAAAAAGVFATGGTLVRYDGWFVLPFFAVYLLFGGGRRRWSRTVLFCGAAALGPAYWLAHNAYLYGDPLEFYRGPYSHIAIYKRALDAGMARYGGDHDWAKAWLYFRTAVISNSGLALVWLAALGAAVAGIRRAWFAGVVLVSLPAFYMISMYSGGTPIFVPQLWPVQSYYNTRYGLAALPLLIVAAAGLPALFTRLKWQAAAAVLVVLSAAMPWIVNPSPENWICWKESQVNSDARRAWTAETARYLRENYRFGDIFTSFGDITAVYEQAGIPLRNTIHEGNSVFWHAAAVRPDLFLRSEWVVAIAGDSISKIMWRTRGRRPQYRLVSIITVRGAPPVEIYRWGSHVKLPEEEPAPVQERTQFNDQ